MNISRWQEVEVHAALWYAKHRLCFVQQLCLKELMPRNKLDTAHNPRDIPDTAHAPGDNLVLCCREISTIYAYTVNNI